VQATFAASAAPRDVQRPLPPSARARMLHGATCRACRYRRGVGEGGPTPYQRVREASALHCDPDSDDE
jgi:hypothetical protein